MDKMIWLNYKDLNEKGMLNKEYPRLEDFKINLGGFLEYGLIIYESENGSLKVLKNRSGRIIKKLNLNIEYLSGETSNFSYNRDLRKELYNERKHET